MSENTLLETLKELPWKETSNDDVFDYIAEYKNTIVYIGDNGVIELFLGNTDITPLLSFGQLGHLFEHISTTVSINKASLKEKLAKEKVLEVFGIGD